MVVLLVSRGRGGGGDGVRGLCRGLDHGVTPDGLVLR